MLCFSNPGEIDPLLMTTFGANAKSDESPIGFFGTGLKYSIAKVIASGGSITIWSGTSKFQFGQETKEIRGKSMNFVTLNGEPCGFTTRMGIHWQPWMIYRELWSNMKDEGGSLSQALPTPAPSFTHVVVDWSELDIIHENADKYILSSKLVKLAEAPGKLQVFMGPTATVFYKGIKVFEGKAEYGYTYNILQNMRLTEDRTADYWDVGCRIADGLGHQPNTKLLIDALCSEESRGEHAVEWTSAWSKWPEESRLLAKALHVQGQPNLHRRISALCKMQWPELSAYKPASLTLVESKMLQKAKAVVAELGYPCEVEVKVSDCLGQISTMGECVKGEIWLAKGAFALGTKYVTGTLLEELIHLKTGCFDESREMQNRLIDLICTTYENAKGEPI